MVSKTNSSEYGKIVRAEHDDDGRGTHPRTSPGFVSRSSGKITPKYHRGPPPKPATTKNQTRPRPEDITGIGSSDDPSIDPKRIPVDQVELGLRAIQEINAARTQEEATQVSTELPRAVLGSRARTHGGLLIALAKDTPNPTPEA